MKRLTTVVAGLTALLIFAAPFVAQTTPDKKPVVPQVEEWTDDFLGDKLDEAKWEKFTFEGGSGGKIEVKNGEVRIRSAGKTRAGIRTAKVFSADRFIAEAHVAKVGPAYPEPGSNSSTIGFASLTLLFDGTGRNRIEWIFTSENTLEAWAITDGRGERLDNRNLGTKMKNPVLSVVRRGDEFLFILNSPDGKPEDAQIGLTKTVRNMPKSFHVMLYGYGSSENNWDSVRVVVAKQ
jgi:hypothetical protein